MARWVRLIPLEQCHRNAGTFVESDGRELAVFLLTDPQRVVVTDNACPHANGNLSGGAVANGVVTCPWHAWQFDLCTGICVHSDLARVVTYPTRIEDGHIWAELP